MKKLQSADRAGYQRKKWSIMFIGEDGRVVTVRHFKGMVVGAILLLTLLLVAVLVLYHQGGRRLEKIHALKEGMTILEEENSSLKREKDQMLARQVILESKLKTSQAEAVPQAPTSAPVRATEKQRAADQDADMAATTAEKNAGNIPSVEKVAPAAHQETTQTSVPPANIANRNLVVCHDPNAEFVRVEYKVINVGPKGVPVVGRSAIILKNNDMNPEDWIVLPNIPLQDLKPSGEKGMRFRIYNFRTLKYKFAESKLKGDLDSATIFTYTDTGKLLTEKNYPIEMSAEMCP